MSHPATSDAASSPSRFTVASAAAIAYATYYRQLWGLKPDEPVEPLPYAHARHHTNGDTLGDHVVTEIIEGANNGDDESASAIYAHAMDLIGRDIEALEAASHALRMMRNIEVALERQDPGLFRAAWKDLIGIEPLVAIEVLERATPAQRATLEADDWLPLLTHRDQTVRRRAIAAQRMAVHLTPMEVDSTTTLTTPPPQRQRRAPRRSRS